MATDKRLDTRQNDEKLADRLCEQPSPKQPEKLTTETRSWLKYSRQFSELYPREDSAFHAGYVAARGVAQRTLESRETLNAVADAISEFQACGSCAGTTPLTNHCSSCEGEAKVAIAAIRKLDNPAGGGRISNANSPYCMK